MFGALPPTPLTTTLIESKTSFFRGALLLRNGLFARDTMARQAFACSQRAHMHKLNCPALSHQRMFAAVLAPLLAGLSGCYVVPMDPRTGQPIPAQSAPSALTQPGPVTFPVRLYPSNDLASRFGMVNATVSNDLHGRGTFNATINGEAFVGEATRKAGSNREGMASGAGNRGSYLNCIYTMNSSTQGTGQCKLSDGSVFTMHMGN